MVAVVLPHSIECIASMLAAVKLGAAFAPLNGTYPPDRLAYIFHDCQAKAVITPDFMKDVADYSPAAGNAPVITDHAIRLPESQILFPVSSLKDEGNGITKSATGNNKPGTFL